MESPVDYTPVSATSGTGSGNTSGAEEECYRSTSHANRLMHRICTYVDRRELCDVSLVVEDRRIPAHRLVLCAASDYFAAMFTSDVIEARAKEVPLKDVDGNALALLVQYIYTGKKITIISW